MGTGEVSVLIQCLTKSWCESSLSNKVAEDPCGSLCSPHGSEDPHHRLRG